ncbi:MAG: SurA N-terminal domain-containing protein [Polyangiales bacterium]
MNLRTAACLFAMTIALVWTTTSRADVIERVVATVDEHPIFLSDLRRRAAPFLEQISNAETESKKLKMLRQLYEEVLDAMIDEQLLKDEAVRMKIRVTDADIEQAIENVRTQNNLEVDAFWKAVEAQGLTRSGYRADLRRQLLRLKVVNSRVRSRVNITENDVKKRYQDEIRSSEKTARYRVSHVIFNVPDNATPTEVAKVRKHAEAVSAKLTETNLEKTISENDGGEIGWLSEGDLPSNFENALVTLAEGEASEPVRGTFGYHVFFLHEKALGSDVASYEELKNAIYQNMIETAMREQEAIFLSELRKKASVRKML